MAVPYKLNYFEIESGLGTTSTFLHKGDLTANRIIKIGGTSNDILLGDGSTGSLSGKQNTITLTTSGTSGAATLIGATLNIPQYTDQFVGTVTSVGLTSSTSGVTISSSPITTSGNIVLSIATASGSQNGLLSSADWTTFNTKQGAITLTTTGSTGASTLIGNTLNIPNYASALTGYVTLDTTQTITGAKTFQATATFNVTNNPSINAVNGDNLAITASSGTATAIQAISNSGRGIKVESTSNIAADLVSGSGVGLSVTSLSGTIANFYGASFALKASISQAGDITGNSFIKTGGLSTQFLKADGSVDSNTYLTSASLTGYVPYTGATGDVNLGVHSLLTESITLDPTPATIPTAQGSMYFDEDEQTIAAVLNGSVIKIGEDSFFQIKNQSGATIPKGTAVRFDGVVGLSGRVLAVPFLADGTYPSLYFLGVTYESIPDGGDGKALILGKIRGINTNAYIAGTILYASTTVAGGYQTTPPIAPNNIISVAAVVTQGVSNGTILVRPQLGSNINNDEGVKIVTPVTGDLLQLQSSGLWENKSVASLSLVPQSRTLSINGTSYDLTANRSWSVGTITSLTGEATASGSGAVSVTLDNTAVTGKVLTGLNITGGTVASTDSILTALGKVQNQINGLIGGSIFQGTWDANTNTPALTSSVGTNGHYYIVSVAGTTNLNGITDWEIGDWAIFAGTSWQKVDNTDAVVAVNGYTGNVSLVTGDVLEGAGTIAGRPSQLYFTDARARAAISLTTSGSSGASTYNSTTGVLNIPNYSPDLSGYVTLNTAQTITAAKTFSTSGGDNTLVINHLNGSGIGLSITKGGNGEGLYVNKTSGSGNAATIIGTLNATKLVTNGGISSQFLKADGSVDSSAYITLTSLSAGTGISYNNTTGVITNSAPDQTVSLTAGAGISISGTYPSFTIASTITQYTDALARAALSFVAGSGAYNSTTGVITIPTNNNQITNGSNFITLTSLSAGAGISYNNTTGAISSTITQYTDALARAAISLTTTGTSGAATYNSTTGVLNIPNYAPDLSGYVPTSRTITINGTSFDLSANRTYSVGTVTSVGLSSSTSGVTIGSTPITTSGTITLAIATASGSQQGLLSSTDWTTFNNKQNALNGTGFVKISGTTISYDNSSYALASSLSGYLPLSGGTLTGALTGTSASFTGGVVVGLGLSAGIFNQNTPVSFSTNGTSNSPCLTLFKNSSSSTEDVFRVQSFIGAVVTVASIKATGAATFSSSVTAGGNIGNSQVTLSNAFPNITFATNGNIVTTGANPIAFRPNDAERMRITSGGNVGIGTPTPDNKLNIFGVASDGSSSSGNILSLQISDTQRCAFGINSSGNTFIQPRLANLLLAPSGGNVLIGTSSPISTGGASRLFQIEGTTNFPGISVVRHTADSGAPNIVIGKSRATANGGVTIVQNGDDTGFLSFVGANGVNLNSYTAAIFSQVDGTPSSTSMPGRLILSTTASGATNPTERMRITSSGRVLIGSPPPTESTFQLDVNGTGRFSGDLNAGQSTFTNTSTPVRLNNAGGRYTQLDFLNNGTQKGAIWWDNVSNSLNLYSGVTALTLASTGAATFSSSVTASSLIKSGGTSSQYLMADGSTKTIGASGSGTISGTGVLTFSGTGSQSNFDTGIVYQSTLTDFNTLMVVTPITPDAGSYLYSLYFIDQGGGLFTYGIVFSLAPASGTNNIKFNYILTQIPK
jgi:hypothetical protein